MKGADMGQDLFFDNADRRGLSFYFIITAFALTAVFLAPESDAYIRSYHPSRSVNLLLQAGVPEHVIKETKSENGSKNIPPSRGFEQGDESENFTADDGGEHGMEQGGAKTFSISEILVKDEEQEVSGEIRLDDPLVYYSTPEMVKEDAGLEEFLQAEVNVLDTMRRAHAAFRETTTEIWAARGVRRRATAALNAAVSHSSAEGMNLERLENRLAVKYRALYKLADGCPGENLFAGFHRAVPQDGRMELAKALAWETKRLNEKKEEFKKLLLEQQRKEKLLEAANERVSILDKKRDGIQAVLALQDQYLSDLRRRKEQRDRSREVWDNKMRRLNRSVQDVAKLVSRESRSFLSFRGNLPRPVPGMILNDFGETPVEGTSVTAKRRGVDISALKEWKVRATARGVVRYAGMIAGFHKVVIIDHGEGFLTVTGRLQKLEVAKGQIIEQGRALGEVFHDPECRRWDCTRVYFELRRGSVALNPSGWFRSGS